MKGKLQPATGRADLWILVFMTPEIFKHSLRRFAQGAHSFHHKTSQPTHSVYVWSQNIEANMLQKIWMIIFTYVAQHPSRYSLLPLRKALPITKHLCVLQDTLRPEFSPLLNLPSSPYMSLWTSAIPPKKHVNLITRKHKLASTNT
jgi:hypothetical protein